MVSLSSLCEKDIISISSGQNIGRADDIEFDEKTAVIENLVVYGRPKFFGLFGREKDIKISWADIMTIGRDVVLIKSSQFIDAGNAGKSKVKFD